MKRYVEQLLEDIESVQANCIDKIEQLKADTTETTLDDFIEPEVEEGIKLSDLFDMQQFFLPDESYLDDEEVKVLSFAIVQLWRSYNLNPLFNKKLPKRIKYSLLRDYWNQVVYPNPDNKTDIELCDYSRCPYCLKCPVCTHKKGFSSKVSA